MMVEIEKRIREYEQEGFGYGDRDNGRILDGNL